MGLDAQRAKRHGTCHEMLHNALYAFHLVEWCGRRRLLKVHEVADKDGTLFLVHQLGPVLKLFVVALPCGQLQLGNGLRVPGMFDTVLTPRELSLVRQESASNARHPYLVSCNLFQSNAANGAHLCAKVASQQVLAQSNALENLRSAIGPYGRDAHFGHDFLQSFIYSLDVMAFRRGVFLLNLAPLHQVVQDGKDHIWTQCAGTIAQQQGSMHCLTDFSTLYNQCCLHTLAHANQIVMHSTDSQEGGNGRMLLIDVAVGEDDIVHALVNTRLSSFAEFIKCLAQPFFTLCHLKRHWEFSGIEALIPYIT